MGRCRFEQMLALDSESAGAWTGVEVAPTSGALRWRPASTWRV